MISIGSQALSRPAYLRRERHDRISNLRLVLVADMLRGRRTVSAARNPPCGAHSNTTDANHGPGGRKDACTDD